MVISLYPPWRFPAFCWNIWQERNFRVFMQNHTTWEITLKGILDQVRTKAIFLNLDISPPLCASWNLPQPSLPQITDLITMKQNEPCWNLLIVIRDHESVGAFRESTGQLKWIFHWQDGSTSVAAHFIEEASKSSNHLVILSNDSGLTRIINGSKNLHWSQTFSCKIVQAAMQGLRISSTHVVDVTARKIMELQFNCAPLLQNPASAGFSYSSGYECFVASSDWALFSFFFFFPFLLL